VEFIGFGDWVFRNHLEENEDCLECTEQPFPTRHCQMDSVECPRYRLLKDEYDLKKREQEIKLNSFMATATKEDL
jgi:hypothetical protein